LVAGAAGVPVYWYAQNRVGLLAAGAVILGVYWAIDWLGLLPPPFEPDVRSMLHAPDESEPR
jgi:hypothetical protein